LTGTVLALFGLSFLGFAITELWAARIERELADHKLMKNLKSIGKKHKINAQRQKYLAEKFNVDGSDAEKAFSTDKKEFKRAISKVRGS
jgi:hypothetical protein